MHRLPNRTNLPLDHPKELGGRDSFPAVRETGVGLNGVTKGNVGMHEVVRDACPKNDNLLLTQSPNATDLTMMDKTSYVGTTTHHNAQTPKLLPEANGSSPSYSDSDSGEETPGLCKPTTKKVMLRK